MSMRMALILTTALLVLALSPWIVSSCASRPLVPDAYAAERNTYETRVADSQLATRTAERLQPGEVNVVVISALDDAEFVEDSEEIASPPSPTAELASTAEPTATAEVTSTLELTPVADFEAGVEDLPATPATVISETRTTPTATVMVTRTQIPVSTGESSTTVRVIGTVTAPVPLTTTIRVVVQSEPTAPAPTTTPTGTLGTASTDDPPALATPSRPPLPAGMVEAEDIITESSLRDQLAADAAGSDLVLGDLAVSLDSDGVRATAMVETLLGVSQPVDVTGTFAVENDSLVFQVSVIRLNGKNVTSLYRGQLVSSVNSSLYRLLPQRYVKSFTLGDGQVLVNSLTRSR